MGSFANVFYLANSGSTGTVTSSELRVGNNYEAVVFQFEVTAAGATPTVTYKFQGTVDGTNWYDVGYITDASDTISQTAKTRTTVGADILFLSNPVARQYRGFRLVVSANTNITYNATMFLP